MSDFTTKQQELLTIIANNLEALSKAKDVLIYSQDRCQILLAKSTLADNELESCEALTSRFARAADLLTQKVLPAIFAAMQEAPATFIDRANLAAKLGMVSDAKALQAIRGLRNEIAHEYTNRDLRQLFSSVSELTATLLIIIDQVTTFANKLIEELR